MWYEMCKSDVTMLSEFLRWRMYVGETGVRLCHRNLRNISRIGKQYNDPVIHRIMDYTILMEPISTDDPLKNYGIRSYNVWCYAVLTPEHRWSFPGVQGHDPKIEMSPYAYVVLYSTKFC